MTNNEKLFGINFPKRSQKSDVKFQILKYWILLQKQIKLYDFICIPALPSLCPK